MADAAAAAAAATAATAQHSTLESILYDNPFSERMKETLAGLIVYIGYLLFALALFWAKRKPIKKALMRILGRRPAVSFAV
jgi:hypothetical protein